MTVAELIALLQTMPPGTSVVYAHWDGDDWWERDLKPDQVNADSGRVVIG